jgi:hypothetical protein
MRRAPLLLVLLALGSDARPSDLPAALLDASGDRVAARADVPDGARRVGEVRLVTRGEAVVVQTLLATKVLPRVLREIREKEAANWPADVPGHDDMERYVAALERAGERLRTERDAEDGGERRLRLLIELVATPEAAGLVVGGFEVARTDGPLEPTARRAFETTTLGRTYVVRNMRLILADAFGVSEDDVERLGPLGPIARP